MIGGGRSQAAPRRATPAAMASGRTAGRPRGRTRRRLPRPRPRLIAALLAVVLIGGGAWLWLRNSSLVAVRHVTITGVVGPDADQIRSALTGAARGMTTLDVKLAALRTAVKPFPVVKHLTVSTSFPHAMRITVSEQVPVAEISADGRQMAVSADGTLLRDAAPTGSLPTISVPVFPGGTHVGGAAASEVSLLAAAPYALLGKVSQVSSASGHGLAATLRNGPVIYFGDASQLGAKWAAATAVLASSGSAGASYIDVTVASRPVAGTGPDTAANSSAGAGSTAGGTGTAPSSGTGTAPASGAGTGTTGGG
jgi:cell division protein FtsQ